MVCVNMRKLVNTCDNSYLQALLIVIAINSLMFPTYN